MSAPLLRSPLHPELSVLFALDKSELVHGEFVQMSFRDSSQLSRLAHGPLHPTDL